MAEPDGYLDDRAEEVIARLRSAGGREELLRACREASAWVEHGHASPGAKARLKAALDDAEAALDGGEGKGE